MLNFPSQHHDDAEASTGLLFMRAYNKWHGEIKLQLKSLDLTHPQFVVMASLGYLLHSEAEVTQVMISKLSGIDVMTVSQIITLLEKKKFITRVEHSTDTRAKSVTISSNGLSILKQAIPVVETIDNRFFGSLKAQQSTFIELLKTLNTYQLD